MEKEKVRGGWKSNILSGFCGAVLGAVIIVFAILCRPNFKRTSICFVNNSHIDSILEKTRWSSNDTTFLRHYLKNDYLLQANTLKALKAEKVIITPEQYSSDLSDYYNTLIAVLAALLVILNIIAYLSLKTNAETEYRAKIQELDEQMNEKLSKVTENLLLDSEKVHNRIQALLIEWSDKDNNEEEDGNPKELMERLDTIEKNIDALVELLAEQDVSKDKEKTGAIVVTTK